MTTEKTTLNLTIPLIVIYALPALLDMPRWYDIIMYLTLTGHFLFLFLGIIIIVLAMSVADIKTVTVTKNDKKRSFYVPFFVTVLVSCLLYFGDWTIAAIAYAGAMFTIMVFTFFVRRKLSGGN